MMKRFLSLALTIAIVLSLFSGLTLSASAAGSDTPAPIDDSASTRMVRVEFYNNDGSKLVRKTDYFYAGGVDSNGRTHTFGFNGVNLMKQVMGLNQEYITEGFEASVIGWSTQPGQTVPNLTPLHLGTAYNSTTAQYLVENGFVSLVQEGEDEVLRFYSVYGPAEVTARYWTPDGEKLIMDVTKTYSNPYSDGNTIGFAGKNLLESANALAPAGMVIGGWSFTKNGSAAPITKTSYPINEVVEQYGAYGAALKNENGSLFLDIYAVWEPSEYDIVFHGNGGLTADGESTTTMTYTYDAEQALADADTFTRENFTFRGWAETPDATEAKYDGGEKICNLGNELGDQVDLYAVWTRDLTDIEPMAAAYQVAYYFEQLDGEYVLDETATLFPVVGDLGAVITAEDHPLTRTGYHLNTAMSSDVVVAMPKTDDAGELVVTTLKVYYALNEYTVTFNSLGGTPVEEQIVKHGGTAVKPENPKKRGFLFQSWFLCKDKYDFETPVTSDITLVAIWKCAMPVFRIKVLDKEEVGVSHYAAPAGTRVYLSILDDEVSIREIVILDKAGNKLDIKQDHTFYYFVMPASDVTITVEHLVKRTFIDVNVDDYFFEAVEWAVDNGITTGMTWNTFVPDGLCNRAQAVTFLWRAAGCPDAKTSAMVFTDVAADAWYYEAVLWAVEAGVVKGVSDTEFAPDLAVTREQMVTILWRYAQYENVDVSVGEETNILSYDDAFDVSEYAIPAMQWGCGSGMITGMKTEDGGMILDPQGTTNRAQMVTMLMRYENDIAK